MSDFIRLIRLIVQQSLAVLHAEVEERQYSGHCIVYKQYASIIELWEDS